MENGAVKRMIPPISTDAAEFRGDPAERQAARNATADHRDERANGGHLGEVQPAEHVNLVLRAKEEQRSEEHQADEGGVGLTLYVELATTPGWRCG